VIEHTRAVAAAAWLITSQTIEALAFAPAFTLLGSEVTTLEVVAFGLALAMVALNIRVNAWAWPFAMASSALYGWLFWHVGLFGEAGLQGFFIAVAGWGWWQWLRGRCEDGSPLRVRPLTRRGRLGVLAAMALAWPALGLFLDRATSSTVPWWDAFPTAGSVIGQWLLGRQFTDNWMVWLVVNLVSIGLFASKDLWLTALLYAIFAVLSLVGWFAWRRLEATADRVA
jgi:nicotinamide mononucleotide transporter